MANISASGLISLDNDIRCVDRSGKEVTGYDVALKLVDYFMDTNTACQVNAHSFNPIAAESITSLMNNYYRHSQNNFFSIVDRPPFIVDRDNNKTKLFVDELIISDDMAELSLVSVSAFVRAYEYLKNDEWDPIEYVSVPKNSTIEKQIKTFLKKQNVFLDIIHH